MADVVVVVVVVLVVVVVVVVVVVLATVYPNLCFGVSHLIFVVCPGTI